jgi:hypothetical protein
LHREGQVADLIEQQRASLGRLERTALEALITGAWTAVEAEQVILELALWMARASSSLPVPLSPTITTRESVPASMWACDSFSSMTALRVMISARQSSSEAEEPEIRSAFATWSSSSCFSTGLVRNPKAPIWVACTASGIVPCAVRMMTLSPGQRDCSSLSSPIPSIWSMRRSLMTRSGLNRGAEASACAPLSTASTS